MNFTNATMIFAQFYFRTRSPPANPVHAVLGGDVLGFVYACQNQLCEGLQRERFVRKAIPKTLPNFTWIWLQIYNDLHFTIRSVKSQRDALALTISFHAIKVYERHDCDLAKQYVEHITS